MLVVGEAAQDRARAETGQAQPRAEQGQHHLAVEEAAAIEQREDEIHVGPLEKGLVAVLEHEVEPERLQYLARLDMVERVIAVLRMEAARPFRVLGDEHDAEPLLGFRRNQTRFDKGGHEGKMPFGRVSRRGPCSVAASADIGGAIVASKGLCKIMTVSVEKLEAARLMTQGGDARILLDPATGLNRYYSAPRPSAALAYASSTANDVSPAAYARAREVLAEIGPNPSAAVYADRLEALRRRIRRAYGVADEVAIVLAPSGTDLEYVALACVAGRAPGGTHAILLGADEVGSGCIHSAHGLYFAEETALGIATRPGAAVPGLGGVHVELVDIPVRDRMARVRPSTYIAERMRALIAAAHAASRHSLVHIVHGSKTGLILPSLADVDSLIEAHGDHATLVVDACQARITAAAVNDYLARGAIVFVTGSKFMGGPPFSGFALVPQALARAAPPLPEGFATLFRRGEWPAGWPGADALPDSANIGLLLRLDASIFELERFDALDPAAVARVIRAFHAAVRAEIVDRDAGAPASPPTRPAKSPRPTPTP